MSDELNLCTSLLNTKKRKYSDMCMFERYAAIQISTENVIIRKEETNRRL